MTDPSLLEIDHVTMKFGGLTALSDISLCIDSNDLVAIIGPNGAGKTTLFNVITGIYRPTTGSVLFNQKPFAKRAKPSDITVAGIARTFQNIRLFKDLTVLDNIRIGHHARIPYRLWDSIFYTSTFVTSEKQLEERCDFLLEMFQLKEKKYTLARNLSYGEQRKLEIARALATEPKLLLLDEPAAGMNPTETMSLMELIRKIRKEFQLAIVLIEHDMKLVMNLAEKVFVLNYGHLLAQGAPEVIQTDQKVIEAYLGADMNLESVE